MDEREGIGMETMLLVLFINWGGGGSYGNVGQKIEIAQPDMATCESVAEHLSEIFAVDPALSATKVSINCLPI